MEGNIQRDGGKQLENLKSKAEAGVLGHSCHIGEILHAFPDLVSLFLEHLLDRVDEASQLQVISHHVISVLPGLVGLFAEFPQGPLVFALRRTL